MKSFILNLIFLSVCLSLNSQSYLNLQNLSGNWYNESVGEEIRLSASEYFEMEGDYGSYYGIWGVDGQQLQFGFASTGNMASYKIAKLIPGQLLRIIVTDTETGEEVYSDYTYLGAAPTYYQTDVARVVQEFQTAMQMQMQMMNAQHRMNMRIINAIGGSTTTIVRDEYGNIIDEY